jgi:hypothetical protein
VATIHGGGRWSSDEDGLGAGGRPSESGDGTGRAFRSIPLESSLIPRASSPGLGMRIGTAGGAEIAEAAPQQDLGGRQRRPAWCSVSGSGSLGQPSVCQHQLGGQARAGVGRRGRALIGGGRRRSAGLRGLSLELHSDSRFSAAAGPTVQEHIIFAKASPQKKVQIE